MTKNVILALTAGIFVLNTFEKDTADCRIVITSDNFTAEVEDSRKPVLVEFWAPWCRPCRTIDPHLKAISSTNNDVVVAKVNVEDNKELSERFRISSIPCMVLFKDGKEVSWLTGSVSKAKIEDFIARNK